MVARLAGKVKKGSEKNHGCHELFYNAMPMFSEIFGIMGENIEKCGPLDEVSQLLICDP